MPRGLNFYIFLAVVAFWIGGAVVRKLREQAQKKRAIDARRQREEDILRTGRDPQKAAPTPEAALELRQQRAVESRRTSELEELRRRRAGADRPAPAPSEAPAGIVIQIPGVAAPIVIKAIPRGPGLAPARGTPVPPPAAPQRATRQRPGSKRKPRPSTTTPMIEPAPADAAESTVFRAAAATPAQSTGLSGPDAVFEAPRTPAEWRRAMILREVLGTPVGMREPGSGPGPMG
ncbi:MAG: hypothetical protein ACKVU4_09095 [Phycisphaerales bacterium]